MASRQDPMSVIPDSQGIDDLR